MGILGKRSDARAQQSPQLVELAVGYERTAAFMIVGRCEAEDIPIKLLTMDDNGLTPGIAALAQHRVLVRETDRERVESIIRQS